MWRTILPPSLPPRRTRMTGRRGWNLRLIGPARSVGSATRFLRRVLDPVFYIRTAMAVIFVGLVTLPLGTDLVIAALKPVDSPEGVCRILFVQDGDTVILTCPGWGMERARLLGLDAPEKFTPKCMAELVAAEKAAWALRGMILKADRVAMTNEGEDGTGRALVRLTIDGETVALPMIRAGHARIYGGGLRGSWC